MPEAANDLIREKVNRAMSRISEFKPYKITTPVRLDVRFKNYRPAEVLSYLSIVERTDAHSIRFQGRDMIETSASRRELIMYTNTTPLPRARSRCVYLSSSMSPGFQDLSKNGSRGP